MSKLREFLDQISHAQLLDRLNLALDGASLGIWDWDLRDNSVQFDHRWCEMIGLDPATTEMHLKTWEARVHPDDLAGAYRDIQAHIEGRTARYENIHRMQHTNGSWVYILDRGRISGRDETGKPIRFTGTHFDVTATERARQILAHEGQQLAALVANLPTGVLMLDLELRVLAASDHWEFSAPEHPAALRGRLLHEVLPPGTPWEAAAAQALTGEASRVDEDASVFRGARRFLHWDARPWRTVDGAIGGVLLSAEDVTDRVVQRQQAERERDTRLATLSLFAGGVAHEINNPLQVILLEAELIGREATAEAPSLDAIAESAQSVADTARRAGAITRALRTLSRDARSDPAEAVPVTRLLRDAEALCRARFASGGVALTLDDRSAGAKVLGRPAELLHVLLNLLHNAHDAAKGTDGAWTRLSAEREGDTVVFRCVDSGPGVSREDIPRLMDPFFTTKEVGHGTGLGLAIAQALATRDGGTLTYEADAAHTTFVVRVPAASEVAP